MIFRPLALVAAIAGLSSAEVSYSIKEELLASSNGNGSGQYEMDVDIQAGNAKSLLMSLSSEIYLLTQTTAKDQNKGGGKTTTAEAEVKATIKYCTGCIEEPAEDICETEDGNAVNDGPTVYEASPKGGVVMASRTQELSVDVDLNCGDLCTITGYVEVGLKLETKAAQSFTWVAELRDTTGTGSNSDPIRSVACFNWDSSAEIPDVSSSAVGIQDTVFIVTEAQPSKLREALP